MTLNLLYSKLTKVLFIYIFKFITWLKQIEVSSLLQIVTSLKMHLCALVELNMGTSSDADHIKPIDQFCPRTGQHSFSVIIPAWRVAESSTDVL